MSTSGFTRISNKSNNFATFLHAGGDVEAFLAAHYSETERLNLAALLICAQEEERARIARELHDDIAQQLALICMQIDQIRISSRPKGSCLDGLRNATKLVEGLGFRVRRLAHALYAPELDILGLGPAIARLCREFGVAHGIDVKCDYSGLPERLPNNISLCLYRVTQESLQNVAKHSKASRALVSLRVDDGELHLKIQDFGCGFRTDSNGSRSGMGLRSMRERVRLVGGRISIQSKLHEGTTIETQVSLASN